MLSLLVHTSHPLQTHRLTGALDVLSRSRSGRYRVQWIEGWSDLITFVAARPPSTAVIDPFYAIDGSEARVMERWAEWKRVAPVTATLVYASKRTVSIRTLLALGSHGASEVVLLAQQDSPGELAETLDELFRGGLRELAVLMFGGSGLPDEFQALVRAIADDPCRRWSSKEMARTIFRSRTTLYADLRRWELPTPEAVLMRTRLLIGLFQRRWTECTVETAAARAGFSSASAFSRQTFMYTGLRPSQVPMDDPGWHKVVRRLGEPKGRPDEPAFADPWL